MTSLIRLSILSLSSATAHVIFPISIPQNKILF
jgi:hypothetical protein